MADNRYAYGIRYHSPRWGSSAPRTQRKLVADAYQAQDEGSGFSVDLNVGDPLKLVAGGTVALAIGTQPVSYIMVGVESYYDGAVIRNNTFLPGASTGGGIRERLSTILVIAAEQAYWSIMVDDKVTFTTRETYEDVIGKNVTVDVVGDATTKEARPLIDIDTTAVDEDRIWRIEGIDDTLDNQDFAASNVRLVCSINSGQYAGMPATSVVGV